MSKGSGVTGKTLPQLARSKAAAVRQEARDARTPGHQSALLTKRPGQSLKEQARLAAPE